jgi:hypothetical protein
MKMFMEKNANKKDEKFVQQSHMLLTCSRKTWSWGWEEGLTVTSNKGMNTFSRMVSNDPKIPISL